MSSNDAFILDLLSRIHNESAALTSIAERSLMRQLDGGCSIPISVRSYLSENDSKLTLHANILSIDGVESVEGCAAAVLPKTAPVNRDSTELLNSGEHNGEIGRNASLIENNMTLVSTATENELKAASDPSSVFMGVMVTPISEVSRLRMAISRSLGSVVGNNLRMAGGDKILHEIRSQSSGHMSHEYNLTSSK
ncbi:unnamed protein product [Heterobilharzia americana]|nr:unnamed protein product [Heterobilharzia americana]